MRLLVLFLLWASPPWAQVTLPQYDNLQSNLGPVSVQYVNGMQQVFVNGTLIPSMESTFVTLHGLYNHAADGSQTVLLSMRHRGNGCFDDWAVIRIAAGQIKPSAPFGGCGRTVRALRVDAQGLELDMGSRDLTHDFITFRFSGAGYTSTATLRNDTTVAPATAGTAVTRWVGSHPADIFKETAERQRFRTIMTDVFLNDLRTSVMVANRVIQEGDYVYGSGCWPHACNATAGVWALRVSDGAVFAVIWNEGSPARIAGASLAGLPYRLQNFALSGNF